MYEKVRGTSSRQCQCTYHTRAAAIDFEGSDLAGGETWQSYGSSALQHRMPRVRLLSRSDSAHVSIFGEDMVSIYVWVVLKSVPLIIDQRAPSGNMYSCPLLLVRSVLRTEGIQGILVRRPLIWKQGRARQR